MKINIDEELAKLEAEMKKLTLIQQRRNEISALKHTLFPIETTSVTILPPVMPPVTEQLSAPHRPALKKDQIAEFAKNYLIEKRDATTSQIVAAIEAEGKGKLLADRKNKVVAVSQALGKSKDIFGTDRSRGWFLNTSK